MASAAACIFCKIIKGKFNKIPTLIAPVTLPRRLANSPRPGEIPSMKLFESEKVFAFLDIGPLSKGHALVIPKFHGAKLTDIPDDELTEVLPTLKKLIKASGATDYNILQNNGTIAHQQVHHVHFHMIPKPNETEGLGIRWPTQEADMDQLKALCEDIKSRI